MKIYIVVKGNYALRDNIYTFSSKKIAEKFKAHMLNETNSKDFYNIFEKEVDYSCLKEVDM